MAERLTTQIIFQQHTTFHKSSCCKDMNKYSECKNGLIWGVVFTKTICHITIR